MTLANRLTILRICLVPALVILLVYGDFGWALIVFLVAGVTDVLDGLAARLRNERTELGTMLDPIADKLLVTSSLVVLSLPSENLTVRIPPWVAILSISRDAGILLAALVFTLAIAKRSFPPSVLGKATTVVQLAMIVWVLGCNYRSLEHPWTDFWFGATVALVVASALHYLVWMHRLIAAEESGRGREP